MLHKDKDLSTKGRPGGRGGGTREMRERGVGGGGESAVNNAESNTLYFTYNIFLRQKHTNKQTNKHIYSSPRTTMN